MSKTEPTVTPAAPTDVQAALAELVQAMNAGDDTRAAHAAGHLAVMLATRAGVEVSDVVPGVQAAKPRATGRYTSKLPDVDKAAIHWQQPVARQAPLFGHEVTCVVCGRDVVIETHSPNAPATCTEEKCITEYSRQLNRERVRRYRARKRSE